MSSIKFNKINETLKIWEEFNLLAVFLELCHKNLKSKPFSSAIGSQLENSKSLRRLVRPIPYYKVLRKILENKGVFDPKEYLPSLPTSLRSKFSCEADILFSSNTQKLFLFPWFLSHWLRQKRVCHIDCLNKIQPVVPTKENYLRFLPFDDFLLSLPEPICAAKIKENLLHPFKLFFVHREGDRIYLLGLREDIELNLKEISEFNEEDNSKKIKELKYGETRFSKKSFGIDDSNFIYVNWIVDVTTGENIVCKDFEMQNISWDDEENFIRKMKEEDDDSSLNVAGIVFWLNGLCKLFATSAKSEYEFISNPTSYKPKVSKGKHACPVEPEMEWFEVPHSTTVYLTMEEKENESQMISRIGSSKKPHEREGHKRRYRDSEGKVVHEVDIPKVSIHKYKPDMTKQSEGAVSKIK